MDFTGKTAVVTGASVGIGRAVALQLAEKGANLILVDINIEKLESVKNEIENPGGNVSVYKCDISDEAMVNHVIQDGLKKYDKIDILVNNAAIWRLSKPFIDMTADEWTNFFNINVMGTIFFSKAVLPSMIKNNYGRIINISSVAGVYGIANMTAYSATKGAINSLTKALAKEVSHKGVLVNSVCPGSVSSSENPDIDSYQTSELSFMGRTGTDRENANLICFLASDKASYISGQTIQIDGCRKKL